MSVKHEIYQNCELAKQKLSGCIQQVQDRNLSSNGRYSGFRQAFSQFLWLIQILRLAHYSSLDYTAFLFVMQTANL